VQYTIVKILWLTSDNSSTDNAPNHTHHHRFW